MKTFWHSATKQEVLEKLGGTEQGLSGDDAARRLKEHGPNELEKKEEINPLFILLNQIRNPLIYLLFAATVISLLVRHWIDAGIILLVVVINTLLGFIQEYRAEKTLDALQKMTSPKAKVRRNGKVEVIPSTKVVPGDLLILETGDRVAADGRMIESIDLAIDESALTGESNPANKSMEILPEDTPLADRDNMVWSTTVVTGGRGSAVITGTGMDTELGKIAEKLRSKDRQMTPLQRRMGDMSAKLGAAGVVLALLLFGLGLARGFGLFQMLLFAIAVAVSAIPEGLPAVISITLALGMKRMARHNALIRSLPAVETLGSTTVICTDKTGTITKNEMTVTRIWTADRLYEVSGVGYKPEGKIEDLKISDELARVLKIGAVCNNAHLSEENNIWSVRGNPTEGALLTTAKKAGMDPDQLRKQYNRLQEFPFSSKQKYMAVLAKSPDSGSILFVKGAPDRVADFCSHIMINDQRMPFTKELRNKVEQSNSDLARQGLRALMGAFRENVTQPRLERSEVEQGLTLAGIWGMLDPARPEAITAVKNCHSAGIHVVMITGDHAETAEAIARKVGIIQGGSKPVTGAKLDLMSEQEVAERALTDAVFARVSPQHKTKILQALKLRGEIVAMTGDGVNDAPALRGADIGVAMGRAGTEVAKEAADMVLTDDDFATIVKAVEEGRIIFANIRRTIFFLITTNSGEIITLAAALLIGLPLPLTAVMILWINLVTDGACTVPLGVEAGHGRVLSHPPRRPESGIFTSAMIQRILFLSMIMAGGTIGLFYYKLRTASIPEAQTVAFTVLAVFQWFQALNARSDTKSLFSLGIFSNRWLVTGLAIAISLQLLVIHTPIGRQAFRTVSLSISDWALILLVGASILVVEEARKYFSRRRKLSEE